MVVTLTLNTDTDTSIFVLTRFLNISILDAVKFLDYVIPKEGGEEGKENCFLECCI